MHQLNLTGHQVILEFTNVWVLHTLVNELVLAFCLLVSPNMAICQPYVRAENKEDLDKLVQKFKEYNENSRNASKADGGKCLAGPNTYMMFAQLHIYIYTTYVRRATAKITLHRYLVERVAFYPDLLDQNMKDALIKEDGLYFDRYLSLDRRATHETIMMQLNAN